MLYIFVYFKVVVVIYGKLNLWYKVVVYIIILMYKFLVLINVV